MKNFNLDYSSCYDLIYASKPYTQEADWIIRHLKKYRPQLGRLIEFGCGTGKHAQEFLGQFPDYYGVDQSHEMITLAKQRMFSVSPDKRVEFAVGDMTQVTVTGEFDAAVALFHVLSYLQTSDQVVKFFSNAYAHLSEGGLLYFDYWYTEGVTYQKPAVRIGRYQNEAMSIIRIADPMSSASENPIRIHYDVFAKSKANASIKHFEETHFMRHFSDLELSKMLVEAGFKVLESGREFAEAGQESLDKNCWAAYLIAKKIGNKNGKL